MKNFVELISEINEKRSKNDKQPLNVNECKNIDELIIDLQLSELNLNAELLEIVNYYDKGKQLKDFYKSNLDALNDTQKEKMALYISNFDECYKGKNFAIINKLNKLSINMIDFSDSGKAVSIATVKKFDGLMTKLREYNTDKNIKSILSEAKRLKTEGLDFLIKDNLKHIIKSNMKADDFKAITKSKPVLNRAETLKNMLSIVKEQANAKKKATEEKNVEA